jgi:hypothetical protein
VTDKWFKPRRFGYGATPTNWKGWAFVGAYVLLVFVVVGLLVAETAPAWLGLVIVAALTAVLVVITKAKTDGEWRWRWH